MSRNQSGGNGEENDGHQEVLGDKLDGSGGCVETWDALTEIRSEEPTSRRRNLLKAVAAVAIGLGVAPGAASADEDATDRSPEGEPAFDVVEVSDPREHAQVKRRALRSRSVRAVRRAFVSNDWRPRVPDVSVVKTVDEEGEGRQYTVAVPFETERGDATIIWTDNPDLETKGLYSETGGADIEFVRYTVERGAVVTTSETVTESELREALAASGRITVQSHTGTFPLCNWNTSCIGKLAAAAGGTVGCCGACSSAIGAAGSAGTSCVCCVLTAIGFVSIDCHVCE